MQNLIKKITTLGQMEYAKAVKEYGHNHSLHEGFAVLKEETDEMRKEIVRIEALMADVWEAVKENDKGEAYALAASIKVKAVYAAAEAIQVAAMAHKFISSEDEMEEMG